MAKYEKVILKNGLTIYFFNYPQMHSFQITGMLNGGRFYELEKEFGSSHFLEHLMFNSTKKFPKRRDLQERIWTLGGNINGTTGDLFMTYSIKVEEDFINDALDVLSQMMKKLLFVDEYVELERTTILSEIKRRLDNPETYFFRGVLPKVVEANKNIVNYEDSEIESVRNTNRETLVKNYKKHYCAKNLSLIILSKLEAKQILPKIEKYFEDMTEGEKQSYLDEIAKPIEKILIVKRDTKQICVGFSFKCVGYLDKRELLQVIFASILQTALQDKLRREKGLTYLAHVTRRTSKTKGFMCTYFPIVPEKAIEATKVALSVIEELKKDIKDWYFEKAINTFVSSAKFNQEKPDKDSSFYVVQDLLGQKIETPSEKITRVKKITKQEIVDFANELLQKDKIGWAFLGDIDEKIEAEIRKLLA